MSLPSYEEVAEVLEYSPDTGEIIRKKSYSNRAKVGELVGYTRSDGYIVIRAVDKQYLAHRLAWLLHYKEWPKGQIDHINHNRNDNRIENLREATGLDNNRNQSLNPTNSSGACGVSWHKQRNKWRAFVWLNNKQKHLGLFDDFDDAVAARLAANKQYEFHKNHGIQQLGDRQ